MEGPACRDIKAGILLALALATVTLALYLPTRGYSWVSFDDNDYVTDNAYVISGLRWNNILWAFTHFHAGYWIPATWMSHMVDCQIWGTNPGPPHLVNAAFHSIDAVLLLFLFYVTTGALWRSALVAALFAWHPLHVESVAWLAERKDVLSTFFWLLAMLAYVQYTRLRKLSWYLATAVLFLLGLMAKPALVTLPLTLLLLDSWPLRRAESTSWTKLVIEKIPLLLISAVFSILTLLTQSRKGAMSDLQQLSLLFRFENALVSYAKYLFKTIWPVDLIAFYPLPQSIPIWKALAAAAILLGLTILVIRKARARPYFAFGWCWFLVTMVPMIGLFQSGAQAMADRFTYVPLIGLFVAVAWGLRDFAKTVTWGQPVSVAVSVGALGACLIASSNQMKQWRDPVSLFMQVLAVAGSVPIAHDHLGAAFFAEGHTEAAIEQFQSALRLNPKYPDAHNNLGTALFQTGQRDEAFAHLREALRLDPNYARAYNNYGNALLQSGKFTEAVEQYEQALRVKPDYWMARNNLGAALLKLDRKEEAFEQFHEALRLQPDFEPARKNLRESESVTTPPR